MKLKNISFFFIVIAMLYSCGINTKQKAFNKNYVKWKNEFPDSLTNHFPTKIDESMIAISSSSNTAPKNVMYLLLLKKISSSEIKKFKDRIPDSCAIKIYPFKIRYGFNKYPYKNCLNYKPVPSYDFLDMEEPNDNKYYLEKINHHVFINEELYMRSYLPNEWKNGMSCGIAISEKEENILYWIIMW